MRFKHFRKPVLIAGVLIGGASMVAGSAQAALFTSTCPFTALDSTNQTTRCKIASDWTTDSAGPALQLGDKLLNIINYDFNSFDNSGNPIKAPGRFDFTWLSTGNYATDTWSVRTVLNPPSIIGGTNLADLATGNVHYTLTVTDPDYQFATVELDSAHFGSGTSVTKTVNNSTILTSLDGSSSTVPLGGSVADVTDTYSVPGAGTAALNSFNNGFTQTPAPLPILGVGAAFGSIRKLRKFSSRLKTFSMG